MAPSLGYLTLCLSLFFSILQFFISLKKNINSQIQLYKIAVIGLLVSIFFAFFSLMYSHVFSDFSVLNVFQNSHTTKPLLYRISGVWGNHEGSMLLWMLVLSVINYWIYKLFNETNLIFVSKTLQIQAFIIIGFLLFILITSNPFERILPAPSNGLGFNPILQDPALAIHPPLLYFGYVGFSAAFSLSIAAMHLNNNNNKIQWYNYMKPFVLTAWTFLTAGIAFGSIWAYYELGWGGWWFWDPVENAALMPWLLGTALLHSLITVERKKSLQTWVLLLAILAFLLSIIGTFLVRSGILTSVHTFALDPTRGVYILLFVALLGGYSLTIFAFKSKYFLNKNYFLFLSKEGFILVNNLLMVIVCASVFFGTTYPLFVEIFSKSRISIGEPYFNSTIIPIIIPAILIMGIAPVLSWEKVDTKKTKRQTFTSLFLAILITIIFFLIYRTFNFFGIVGVFLFSWIICNIIVTLFIDIKKDNNKKLSQFNFFKHFNSMIIAHLGVGLLILGITGSSIWQEEKITRMKVNDKTMINNYNISFKEINKLEGPNYYALQGNFWVYNKKNELITILKPENRIYPITNNTTSEVSIHTNLLRDLYIVLGDGNLNEGWIVRIYYNPLVIWIWIGVLIMFMGGLLALNNNLKNLKQNN